MRDGYKDEHKCMNGTNSDNANERTVTVNTVYKVRDNQPWNTFYF